ncbi:MAG: ABC transporter substrate-binding protein, partial [Candidatus Saccharimonadales bacterium]
MNDPEQPTNPQQTSVSTEVPATPTSPPEPPKTESTEAKKPSKKSHLWLYIIIVVIVIIAALGTWYGVHKSNNQSSTTKKDIPLITYGFDNNPLNVFYPSAAEFGGPMVMNEQIFEGLVSFTNGTQIVPDLATSWTNPNTDTWIFTLRPNTYYHDGDVVTAQDVVYSWQQLNAQDQNLASYTTSTIKNVQATNNNTVEITTTAPDPVLLNRLTNLYIIDSKAPKGT